MGKTAIRDKNGLVIRGITTDVLDPHYADIQNKNLITLVDPTRPILTSYPGGFGIDPGNKAIPWCYVPQIAENPSASVVYAGVQRVCPCSTIYMGLDPNGLVFPMSQASPYIFNTDGAGESFPNVLDSGYCSYFQFMFGRVCDPCNDYYTTDPQYNGLALVDCQPTQIQQDGAFIAGGYYTYIQWISGNMYRIFMISAIWIFFDFEGEGTNSPLYVCVPTAGYIPVSLAMLFYQEFEWDAKSVITVNNFLTPDCTPYTNGTYPDWLTGWANQYYGTGMPWGPAEPYEQFFSNNPPNSIDGFGGQVTIDPSCVPPAAVKPTCEGTSGGSGSGSSSTTGQCGYEWLYTWNCHTNSGTMVMFGGFTCGVPASPWTLVQSLFGLCLFRSVTLGTSGHNCPSCDPGTPPAAPGPGNCNCPGSGGGGYGSSGHGSSSRSGPYPCGATESGTRNWTSSGFTGACVGLNGSGTFNYSGSAITSFTGGFIQGGCSQATNSWTITREAFGAGVASAAASVMTASDGAPAPGAYALVGASGTINCLGQTGILVIS